MTNSKRSKISFGALLCFMASFIAYKLYKGSPSLLSAKTVDFIPDRVTEHARIYKSPFYPKEPSEFNGFEQVEGQELGLDRGYMYDIRDYTDPFWFGRGTASGDYDKDGWPDIIFGSNAGIYLYKNIGGRFKRQSIESDTLKKMKVFAVALVDLNNDDWLDIFFTTYNKGNFLILNQSGQFDAKNMIPVANRNGVLTLSPAFSDLNKDGYLDIVNGNIALGVVTGFYEVASRRQNSIVFNNKLRFKEAEIESDSGETMATLVSDINNDGISDIYFGNDFMIPDKVLLGTESGYEQVKGNQFIPYTPFFSMGADTGDINNDLNLDFLITGTMYVAPYVGREPIDGKSPAEYSQFKGGVETCHSIKNDEYREHCIKIRTTNYIQGLDRTQIMTQLNKVEEPDSCDHIPDETEKDICLTKKMWKLITQKENPENCEADFGSDERLLTVCKILKIRERKLERKDLYGSIPQDDRNMLYTFNPQTEGFEEAKGFTHPGGWTWNSKIVDIDNDGWQDIITSDGTIRTDDYGWNVFMKNNKGDGFEQRQFTDGFLSDFGLYSFVTIDMDHDGDLDIIGNAAEGPVQVYKNHFAPNNHSLAISLQDYGGNGFGIGAKVVIRSQEGSMAQIREIKASGGYMSIEAPRAYFGLGNLAFIDEIQVTWPDQSIEIYPGPFAAGYHYRIERTSK